MIREFLKKVLPESAVIFLRKLRAPFINAGYKYGVRRKYRCACCGRRLAAYIPLPDYYTKMRAKYHAPNGGRAEMVNKEAYSCPWCGAPDRARAYAIYMSRELQAEGRAFHILDIAPNPSLTNFIRKNYPLTDYKTADLFMPHVDYQMDIMHMTPIPDDSIDFFICSHILEHVRDDIQAMRELKRILKPNTGRGICVVPIDLNATQMDEDPDCEDIGERWRRFGQDDHVRKYTREDYLQRLRSVGLTVEEYQKEYFGETAMRENALLDTSTVYVVSKYEIS